MALSVQPFPEAAIQDLQEFERGVQALVARDDAPAGLDSLVARAEATRDRLIELSDADVELELNDELRARLHRYLSSAAHNVVRFLNGPDEHARLDYAVEAIIDLEAMRHILRDGADHEPLRTGGSMGAVQLSRRDAVEHIEKWLPRLTREKQASLLGIDARDIARWRDEYANKPASRRAEIVVDLVGILRHSWTDEGVARWFDRGHPSLAGQRPVDLIDDLDWEAQLIGAAKLGRAQSAT